MIVSLLMDNLFVLNNVNSRSILVIRIPDYRILRIVSRSLFVVMLLMALPWLSSIMSGEISNPAVKESDYKVSSDSFCRSEMIDCIIKDEKGVPVHIERFERTMLVMKKKRGETEKLLLPVKRVLCGVALEHRRAALKGLEDAYLGPPMQSSLAKEPRSTSRKIKLPPDLSKDSSDEYPRRVFISDDTSAVDWFRKKFPTKDQEFQVYEIVPCQATSGRVTNNLRCTKWRICWRRVWKNVGVQESMAV